MGGLYCVWLGNLVNFLILFFFWIVYNWISHGIYGGNSLLMSVSPRAPYIPVLALFDVYLDSFVWTWWVDKEGTTVVYASG